MVAEGRVLRAVLASLPPARFAFAYGSGAFPQLGRVDKPVLDFVLAVDDAMDWHTQNMEVWPNASHYSSMMRFLGPRTAASLQEAPFGAQMYYNALVPLGRGVRIKYGIIRHKALIDDLENWTTLYIAGRMQKPVRVLRRDDQVEAHARRNLQSAACAALLCLPPCFEEVDFYRTIAGLSYTGDVRFVVGAEDPRKISRIVEGSFHEFRQLYLPLLVKLEGLVGLSRVTRSTSDARWKQDVSPDAIAALVQLLPHNIASRVSDLLSRGQSPPRAIRLVLRRLVFRHSLTQSIKGIVTAGPVRSARYAAAKLRKGWSAR